MSRFWDAHSTRIDIDKFRGPDQYISAPDAFPYEAVTWWLKEQRAFLRSLGEDGSFGVVTAKVDDEIVSRDLLDSMLEIRFLEDCGIDLETSRVLDIGAGYGRLAHRLLSAFPAIFVACADPVTVSRFVCRRYLTSSGFAATTVPVLHPDQVTQLRRIDLAINVHSWSECTPEEVEWWLLTLRAMKVPRLFVVPHGKDFSTRDAYTGGTDDRVLPDGFSPPSFRPIIERNGYKLRAAREDWPGEFYPKNFYLFELGAG